MTTERSDRVYEKWHQATERFDYFILGVNGALCAYISQTYKPEKLGINPGTVELLALLLLILAAIAGFRRIERTIQATLLNHQLLRKQEQKGSLVAKSGVCTLVNESTGDILSPPEIAKNIENLSNIAQEIYDKIRKVKSSAYRWYHIRNWLLFLGFSALLGAKVYSAYV